MEAPMWLALLLVGCDGGSITLGEKDGEGTVDTAPTDTAVDDTDDTDTVPSTDERFSGTFAGTADVHMNGGGDAGDPDGGGQLVSCEGPFSLVLHADGSWTGEADCAQRDGSEGFSGAIDGVTDGPTLVGSFVYAGLGFSGEAAVLLTRAGDLLDGTVQDQDRGIAMSLLARGSLDTP